MICACSCTEEDKEEILKSLNYDSFSGEDLLTVVGRSWLLPWEYMEWIAVERFREGGPWEPCHYPELLYI